MLNIFKINCNDLKVDNDIRKYLYMRSVNVLSEKINKYR